MPGDSSETAGEEAARRLISLAEAAELSGLSQGHLRLLVSRGKIWGTKIGRNWVTTETAVKEYLATERRPGPKPKDSEEE
jgi:excisionase family DNA binding protein